MVLALPAASAPSASVTTSSPTDGSPRAASSMVGIVVTSRSSMILGLVRAHSERAPTRAERRAARAGSAFAVAGVNYLPSVPPVAPLGSAGRGQRGQIPVLLPATVLARAAAGSCSPPLDPFPHLGLAGRSRKRGDSETARRQPGPARSRARTAAGPIAHSLRQSRAESSCPVPPQHRPPQPAGPGP